MDKIRGLGNVKGHIFAGGTGGQGRLCHVTVDGFKSALDLLQILVIVAKL